MNKEALASALSKYKNGIAALRGKEPVYNQILRSLEGSSGPISKDEVAEAITQVSASNHNPIS